MSSSVQKNDDDTLKKTREDNLEDDSVANKEKEPPRNGLHENDVPGKDENESKPESLDHDFHQVCIYLN